MVKRLKRYNLKNATRRLMLDNLGCFDRSQSERRLWEAILKGFFRSADCGSVEPEGFYS